MSYLFRKIRIDVVLMRSELLYIPGRLFIVILSAVWYSCFPLDKEVPPDPRSFDPSDTNLRELSATLPYFRDYLRAMDHTSIIGILEAPGPYTIFMPNQVGFSKFRIEKGIDAAEEIPEDTLKRILLYHIVPGHWQLFQIPRGYYPTLATEESSNNPIDLFIDAEELLELNGIVALDEPNLETVNGVLHSISAVLNIPTLLTHLSVNDEFSMISGILTSGLPGEELLEIFQQEGPFTFFAPNNKALESFLAEHDEWQTIEDIPREVLNEILAYHLIGEWNFLLKEILVERMVSTLNGKSLTVVPVKRGWEIRDGSGSMVRVTRNDIQAVNGVIHQVDRVLLPE
jgi:uncharacterized surface protein with fasciclin (FAS1) repeats